MACLHGRARPSIYTQADLASLEQVSRFEELFSFFQTFLEAFAVLRRHTRQPSRALSKQQRAHVPV